MLACISPQPLHHRFETAEIDLAYDQLLIISILLLLVIAIVAGFGLLVMSLEGNSAFGQWILTLTECLDINYTYKQRYLKSNVTINEQEIDQK